MACPFCQFILRFERAGMFGGKYRNYDKTGIFGQSARCAFRQGQHKGSGWKYQFLWGLYQYAGSYGKSEAQVIEELGDPRLLARSIIEAEKRAETGSEQEAEYRTADSTYRYESDRQGGKGYRVPLWLVICIVLLVIVLVLSLVFSVLSFLAPVLIPVMLVIFTVRLFRRML